MLIYLKIYYGCHFIQQTFYTLILNPFDLSLNLIDTFASSPPTHIHTSLGRVGLGGGSGYDRFLSFLGSTISSFPHYQV